MLQTNFGHKPYPYTGINPTCHNCGNIRGEENRGLLLPFLAGAALAFPIGYIASNTNKYNYQMPYYPQPMPNYGYPGGYPAMPPYYSYY